MKSKILNEVYNPKIKKNKNITICYKKDLNTQQKIIKKKNKVNLIYQKRKPD